MNNYVKQKRLDLEMTQSDLAKKIGVSRQTIYAIETKKYDPSVTLALKIAVTFSTNVEDLFALEKVDWD